MLRGAAALLHVVPLFLPAEHQSRAPLLRDGLAPPQHVFLGLFQFPCPWLWHSGSSECSLKGRGEGIARIWTAHLQGSFLPLLRWNRGELRAQALPQTRKNILTLTAWWREKRLAGLFFFLKCQRRWVCVTAGSELVRPLLCSFAVGCQVGRLAAPLLFLVAMSCQ